jgi:hypothetical protein
MKFKMFFFIAISLNLILFSSCKKDKDDASGKLRLEITDSPVDDASVKSVFVTIASVKIGDKQLEGFSKTTIDLMAYQKGNTKLLNLGNVDAKSYSTITLTLDHAIDAQGNSPGCYLEEVDGTKHTLSQNSVEVILDKQFNISSASETTLIIDFDLRKSIKRNQSGTNKYEFVSSAELKNALRVTVKNQTGTIKGSCQDQIVQSDRIIIYAYKSGTFNKNIEEQGSSQSNLKFHNAVNSAVVASNGTYEMHFLEEGEYELYFAPYRRNAGDGSLSLNGSLILDILAGVDIKKVKVNASSNTTVNVNVTGIIPL